MRIMDVADFESGTVSRQTARAQRGQTSFVRQLAERVILVHELRQLRGTEELLDGSRHRLDIDKGLRGDRLDILRRHAFAHDTFQS